MKDLQLFFWRQRNTVTSRQLQIGMNATKMFPASDGKANAGKDPFSDIPQFGAINLLQRFFHS